MPLDIVVGAQWGDEGKGRMVDLFAARARIVNVAQCLPAFDLIMSNLFLRVICLLNDKINSRQIIVNRRAASN